MIWPFAAATSLMAGLFIAEDVFGAAVPGWSLLVACLLMIAGFVVGFVVPPGRSQ